MNTWTFSSLLLIISATLILIGAYYYYLDYNGHDMRYAKTVVFVTSNLSSVQKPEKPELTADNGISEEKGLLIVLLIQVFSLLIAVGFVGVSKYRYGKNKVHLPLIMAAFLVSAWVLHTTYKLGLFMPNKKMKFAHYRSWDCRYAPAPYLKRYVKEKA